MTNLDREATQPVTGEELYSRFRCGDEEAFNSLVEMYSNDLFFFINGIVNDSHEAKHLVIDAFAKLAVGGRKFEGKSSIKTYLFTIGKNLALKSIKMRSNKEHISFEDAIVFLVDEGETPDSYIEREENKQHLQKAMRDLKVEYYEVLMLLYFEDKSYLEAGQIMSKSVKQISDLAYRAKAALKKKMEKEGFVHK